MKLNILVFFLPSYFCLGLRLNPLENNDKLQDLNNQFVAEWQWESWPVKQDSSEQDGKWPGPRVNVALWRDSSGLNWYLFGGRPVNTDIKKNYFDIWKYDVTSRLWERTFPSSTRDIENGGKKSPRPPSSNEGFKTAFEPKNYGVILCGGVIKINSAKPKKETIWKNFSTRRKEEVIIEKETELRTLAVYAPKASASNTVWQIDIKDNLWTAYVCCCDSAFSSNENTTNLIFKSADAWGKLNVETSEQQFLNGKNFSAKSMSNESDFEGKSAQNYSSNSFKAKKKKLNQTRKSEEIGEVEKSHEFQKDNFNEKKNKREKREAMANDKRVINNNKTEGNHSTNKLKENSRAKKEKYDLKTKTGVKTKKFEEKYRDKKNGYASDSQVTSPKIPSKYCPEFSEGIEPITWCDGNNEVLITIDISVQEIALWIFNLKTSHWTEHEIQIPEDFSWSGCSNVESVRYAGIGEEVYIICNTAEEEMDDDVSVQNITYGLPDDASPDNIPLKKLVYQINYLKQTVQYLGKIQLNSFFRTPEGRKIWQNDTESFFQVVRTLKNETILVFAYLDSVDLWILIKNYKQQYCFEAIEKIWRGSALKWFSKYNGPLYNFQLTIESGSIETILMPNPRIIGIDDYWPRSRGRFIIRIFRNENMKNHGFQNRTREQNLTYQLLQSDLKTAKSESQFSQNYSFKVLIFFGVSLAFFTLIGLVMFLKRCVTFPPRIRTGHECQKSPLVIRYSVIPDDLLYPVA